MYSNIFILKLCVYVSFVLCVESVSKNYIKPEKHSYESVKDDMNFIDNDDQRDNQVRSTLFKTVYKYYCSLDSIIKGNHLVVFGSKGWTFPLQDVNLTLRYPTEDNTRDGEAYIITGFEVHLYIDGNGSEGYVVDGGILKESIALTFVSSELTRLMYDFWVHGVRKDTPGILEETSSIKHSCY